MSSAVSSRRGALHNVPPLLIGAAASLLLLAVLPSALNLPQTNPSQTLEFAPVPPEDDQAPPQLPGNFSSLGLGSSASVGRQADGGSDGGFEGGEAPGGRAVKTPSTKRCVGNPPRQTEDVNSPPCVAFYDGDNGGDTYQGVTGEEVRILINVECCYSDTGSRGDQAGTRPGGRIYDLAEPAEDPQNEPYWVEAGRIWQRYFNERFQTYGRFAHLYLSFGTGNGVEQRRSDAVRDLAAVKPFAVIVSDAQFQASLPYVEVMARRGVMAFGITSQLPEELYRKFAGLLWNYWPSLDRQVEQFVDYACTKVVPYRTSFADNDSDPDSRLHNGQPRRLGLIYLDNQFLPQRKRFAMLARQGIAECGGNFVAEASYPFTGSLCCVPANDQAATETVAQFKSEGVTTIVWPQGFSPMHSQAAGRARYYPEWVAAGDRQQEELVPAKYQDPVVWDNAVVVTPVALEGPLRSHVCYQAIQEVAPGHPYSDSAIPCRLYQDLHQLFTGIQVAGPRLAPVTVEKGFRAIPNKPSGSPSVPACFYEPGDYTCVKDAIAQYWDSQAESSYSSSPGCYRVPQGGKRFLLGEWPDSDVSAERSPNDPCNGYSNGRSLDPSPGPDAPPMQ